jgi:Tol biopolymer transport system component
MRQVFARLFLGISRKIRPLAVAVALMALTVVWSPSSTFAQRRLTISNTNPDDNRLSSGPNISADGRWIVFQSKADFLGEGRPESVWEIWLANTVTGKLRRLTDSVTNGGNTALVRQSLAPSITSDGSWVTFYSNADFQAEGIDHQQREIWLLNIKTSELFRLTNSTSGTLGDKNSHSPSISANGVRIAFISDADLLNDGHFGEAEVWVWDGKIANVGQPGLKRLTDMNAGAGANSARNAFEPVISGDGQWVAFHSDGDFLEENRPDNTMEVWLAEVETGALRRITDAVSASCFGCASAHASISFDGQKVFFHSQVDLIDDGQLVGVFDLWYWDRSTNQISRLTNVEDLGSRDCRYPLKSVNSQWIVFESDGDFLNETRPISVTEAWLLNLDTGEFRRATDVAGASPDNQRDCQRPVIDGTGFYIPFASDAAFSDPSPPLNHLEVWLSANPALATTDGWVAR